MKIKNVKMIDVQEWDECVSSTYGRVYSFQQQNGCVARGLFQLSVPGESCDDDMNDNIPEEVNGSEMGVKFETWLKRDPSEIVLSYGHDHKELFWKRNFYPDINTVANDLHQKGLIEAGEYIINIDW